MKNKILFLFLFWVTAQNAFSQGYSAAQQDSIINKRVPAGSSAEVTNRQLNPVLKIIKGVAGNQILNFGTVTVSGLTVSYENISARFGSTVYSLLSGSVVITPPDNDTVPRIDRLVINSDGTLQVLVGDTDQLTEPPLAVSQLHIRYINQNFGSAGGSIVIPYATTAEMNAGTPGKLPDAEKVKAYTDSLVSEAIAGITTGGGNFIRSDTTTVTGAGFNIKLSDNAKITLLDPTFSLNFTNEEVVFQSESNNSVAAINNGGFVATDPTFHTYILKDRIEIGKSTQSFVLRPAFLGAGTATYNLYLPRKSDTLATLSDIAALGGGGTPSGSAGGDLTGTYPNPTIGLLKVGNANISALDFDKTYNRPSTAAGYGLTDVATLTGSQTLTNKTLSSPTINSPTGIVKGDVGLGNVDNTPDASKPVSTAQQTALNLKVPTSRTLTINGVGLDLSADRSWTISGSAPDTTVYRTVSNSYSKAQENTLLAAKAPLASPTFTGTVTVPTPSANDNSTKASSTAYVDAKVADALNDGTTTIAPSQNVVFDALALKADASTVAANTTAIAGKEPLLNAKLDLFSETWASGNLAANYTNTLPTATATQVGSQVNVSGGNSSYNNYLKRGFYTSLEDYEQEITFSNVTDGTGIGLGNKWLSSVNPNSVVGRISLTATGDTKGRLYLDRITNTTITALGNSGSNVLSFSNSDVIRLVFKRSKTTVSITAYNVTTGAAPVYLSYSGFGYFSTDGVINGAGQQPSVYLYGGSQTLLSHTMRTLAPKRAKLLFFGDSIMEGLFASNISLRYFSLLQGATTDQIVNKSYGGMTSADAVNALPELLALKPQNVLIAFGMNDIVQGISQATTIANLTTISTTLATNGIIPIFLYVTPLASGYPSASTLNTNIVALNTAINTAFGNSYKVIDVNTPLNTSGSATAAFISSDNVHPNGDGNGVLFRTLSAALMPEVLAPRGQLALNVNVNSEYPLLSLSNSSAGTSAQTAIRLLSDVGQTYLFKAPSLYSVTAWRNRTMLLDIGNGIGLYGKGGTSTLDFYTNDILRYQVANNGDLLGTNNTNAASKISQTNTSTGITASSLLVLQAGSTIAGLETYSQNYSGDGGSYAGKTQLANTAGTGLVLNAATTGGKITLMTDGTAQASNTRANITSSGLRVGDNTAATSTLQSVGSFSASYVTKTANYTATISDYTIDCTSGTFTVTLPTAVGITGRLYNIINSGSGTITLTANGAETIGNTSSDPVSITLNPGETRNIQSTGAKWRIVF